MTSRRLLIVATEIIVASLLVAGLNLLAPRDPGFLSLYYTPYIAVGLVFAAAYGAGYGIASLAASAGVILGIYPFAAEALLPAFSPEGYWSRQLEAGFIPLLV